MIQRVEQLLNGKFEYESAELMLSTRQLRFACHAGDVVTGSFAVSSPDTRRIRGFLYSSNPRVICDPVEFNGTNISVNCQADTTGLAGGANEEGYITLCTDRGEYTLTFVIEIEKEEETVRRNELIDIDQLCEAAKNNMEETAAVFTGREYARSLQVYDNRNYALSKPLREASQPMQGLEEYLISGGRKEPVLITMEQTQVHIVNPRSSLRESVELKASTWGYLELEISSDERFLRTDKKKLTTQDFIGNAYTLEYIVDVNFLHAGKNYGRISISTCYGTLSLEVLVEQKGDAERKKNRRVQKLMQKRLLTLYLDLRMKKSDMQTWIDRSRNVIASYRRTGGTSRYADLFLAQLYYAEGKKSKGSRILQELGQSGQFENDDQYAYYLYLTTFFERDASYVDQVEARIEQMFLKRRDSWIMQWILLYLKEKYLKDDTAKLEAIEMQVKNGCCSPIMYLEACQLIRKNPYLLTKLGEFEKKILLFGVRQNLITDELVYHTANLVLQSSGYDHLLYRILSGCWEAYPTDDVLGALLHILIEGGKKEHSYFEWYALGVDRELRIPGLYEYYMETMENAGIEKMPQIIRMYFSYNNTLNYHRKAAIFRSISDNRESVPQVYRSSRPSIEHFVIQQLELGRIDEDLAVLYERFLTRKMLTPVLAKQLVKVMFTFEVTCKNPNMKTVAVVHENMKEIRRTPIVQGKARIRIYAENTRIYLEDEEGQMYSSASLFSARRFMDSPLLITYCREMVPEDERLILYSCSRAAEVDKDNLYCFEKACDMESLRDEYRMKCRKMVLEYYLHHPALDGWYDYLRSLSYAPFIQADKKALLTALTQEGMYEEAFRLLDTYGCEEIDPSCLVRICSQMVLALEYDENPLLLAYCYQCFIYGKYNDNIIDYLLSYYDGPVEEMKRLWITGHQNELDTTILEEKILSLILFTRTGSAGTEQIFRSYSSKAGRKKVCRAYLNLRSYEYLVKNLPVSDVVFRSIEYQIENGSDIEDVCRLALLRYYSGLSDLNEERQKRAEVLLCEFSEKDIRFDFFRQFPMRIRTRCQLNDRVFLEYVANPSHEVVVYYRIREKETHFHKERMRNCFEGIFVREFILFGPEQLECYMEEYADNTLVTTTQRVTLTCLTEKDHVMDRFKMLCYMSQLEADGNRELLEQELDGYCQLDYLTREIFTLV